jgi:oxygen-independent coproporphyrinogen III oxidase
LAGIYIHIPFCKQACYYCDFHFSSYLALKDDLIDALVREIVWQKDFFTGSVSTIYFGGGTPSLLNTKDLKKIFSAVSKNYAILPEAEITLEANPDDMTLEKLKLWKDFCVNRLSMGIQTFNDNMLHYLNRIHSADEAIKSFYNARSVGFNNINCDLIFAIPGQNNEILENDLNTMLDLRPEHISAYCLTIEERTVFGNWLKKNKLKQVDEEMATEQMEKVWDFLTGAGFEQYEISNFCRDGYFSRHNSAYWKDEAYLGVGPGAHSYDGENRYFNISNNNLYIKSIMQGQIPFTVDNLTLEDRVNEYILTSLRTSSGCDLKHLEDKFHIFFMGMKTKPVEQLVSGGLLEMFDNRLYLTKKGKLLADYVSSELFITRNTKSSIKCNFR